MLLLILLALLDFGSSYSIEEICYGSSYDVPIYYTPPLFSTPIYYKPRGEGRTLAVSSDGKSKHKRFLVRIGSIKIKDLTEQDDGALVYFGARNSVELDIQECKQPTTSHYGSVFSWKVPDGAEHLEFSQMAPSGLALKPQVIWNRTDASSGRGTVKRNYFELYDLKQKDSGYYKFMGADGQLISWKRLKVNEDYRKFERMEGEYFTMDAPFKLSLLRALFTPQGTTSEKQYMDSRMELNNYVFIFRDLKHEDSGTYRFVDSEGFLALRLELEVKIAQLPGWVYVVALIIIVLGIIFCCCCVKKCCCKKTSDKRTIPESEAAAPPVFYHDTTQPAQPLVPLLEREPRVFSTDPPSYNAAVGNMNPPTSAQVTVPEEQRPTYTPVISTSSDSDPKFEFKGTVFPSAPPLSSGTSVQNVYTSDKLNFL